DDRLEDVTVRLMNESEEPVVLIADRVLSELSPVEVMSEGDEIEDMVNPKFSHLKGLIDDINEEVTVEQKKELKELIEEYSDVFSAHEFDLGVAKGVVHKIETGNARPVRQP